MEEVQTISLLLLFHFSTVKLDTEYLVHKVGTMVVISLVLWIVISVQENRSQNISSPGMIKILLSDAIVRYRFEPNEILQIFTSWCC